MTPVADLIKRLRHMADRRGRHDYSIGDYWNAVDDAADALEAAERERDQFDLWNREANAHLNTARAQVATLAEALKEIAEDAGPSPERTIARAALKAAGVEQ